MPTEDVDVVETIVPGGIAPFTAVWPTEGTMYFINEATGVIYDTEALTGPNISGADFVTDGTWGAFATLGFMHIFDMSGPGGLPVQTVPAVPLPGGPARRDIDPVIISHPGAPSGKAIVYATGAEIHCLAIPTGAILWSVVLPAPVVEACDPVINAANTLLFMPTDGFVTAINPVTGAVLSTTTLNTQLVREIDGRFVLGDTKCYITGLGIVFIFDGTPPGSGGTGALLGSIVLDALVIEGNDMEVDASGTYGFLPTLALMYQINLTTNSVVTTYPFAGAAHERNQDVVFTPPGVAPAKAVYCTEGTMWIYDVASLGAIAPVTVPIAGDLIDGVDPSFTDTAPAGTKVVVATDGFTHIVDVMAGAAVGGSPLLTPGALRMDVDPKPGPVPGGKILQPATGGLWMLSGFGASDWIVTTSTGLHVVDLSIPVVDQFVPTGLIFRGGDAQPTTLLGPPEPGYEVDNPDQDFLAKCNEYKTVINRLPYWYSFSSPYYPTWIPYGTFGPPAQFGWDLLGNYQALLTGPVGGTANQLSLHSVTGYPINTVSLPNPAMGGLLWDWDNSICKLRLQGDQEIQIELLPLSLVSVPSVTSYAYAESAKWEPTIDRINNWSFIPLAGTPRIELFDNLNLGFPSNINLPATCVRKPVFDEERMVVTVPLANRKLFFINTYKLRLGLPNATYSSPDLGSAIASSPVLDVYGHTVITRLEDNRLSVVNMDNGALLWTSPVQPYAPICGLQVDCYNRVAKAYSRVPFASTYYEYRLNLTTFVETYTSLSARPYGVPRFASRLNYEFDQIYPSTIVYRSLTGASFATLTTPYPMVGNLFIDQVNQYALVRLQGTKLMWIDMFRLVRGIPNATRVIDVLDINNLPIATQEDIAFSTRDKLAVVHLADGQIAGVSGISGGQLFKTGGFPLLQRQLFGHPFRGMVSWPYYDSGTGQGGLITIDVTPLRAYIPAQLPTYNDVPTYQPPLEATDFTPPSNPNPARIGQLPFHSGDAPGTVLFGLGPGAVEPGATVQAVNTTRFETPSMDEPNEAMAETNGGTQMAVVASAGDQVCFRVFDSSGNSSGQTCVIAASVVGVQPGTDGHSSSFALTSRNPVADEVRFRFVLPTRSDVDLTLYDISGRQVATVLHETMDAGEHDAVWSLERGHRPAPGVYLARFRAGAFKAVERIVLIR